MNKVYPDDYSDKEIRDHIKLHLGSAERSQMKPGVVAYEFGHAQLGFSEIDKRRNRWITVLSLSISVTALCITAFYSYYDYIGDKAWQVSQTNELQKITESLNNL